MEEKIIIAGFGGQGIMFTGKLICQAGMKKGFNVTYLPSYGAEVRGGTAHCNVVVSDNLIASPVVEAADTLIMMNEPSLLKFESLLRPEGLVLFNSTLINVSPRRNDISAVAVPATAIAYQLGNVKVANMVMLGKYIASKEFLPVEEVKDMIKGPLSDLNTEAISEGVKA